MKWRCYNRYLWFEIERNLSPLDAFYGIFYVQEPHHLSRPFGPRASALRALSLAPPNPKNKLRPCEVGNLPDQSKYGCYGPDQAIMSFNRPTRWTKKVSLLILAITLSTTRLTFLAHSVMFCSFIVAILLSLPLIYNYT